VRTIISNVNDIVKTALICTIVAFLITSFDPSNKLSWATYVSSYTYGLFIHTSIFLTHKFTSAEGTLYSYVIPALIGFILATAFLQTVVGGFISKSNNNLDSWIYIALLANALIMLILFIQEQKNRLSTALKQANYDQLSHEKALAEAKLQALQSQIEPHFLFNTIANIKASIHTDPNKASLMIDHLSNLLRQSVKRSKDAQLSLKDELELCRSYLEIQSIRMNHRLSFTIDVDDSINLEQPFPSLLIQPLVENAILHGAESLSSVCQIDIVINCNDLQQLNIRVRDTGIGLGNSSHSGQGLGLDNIRKRLSLYSSNEASFTLSSSGEWTDAVITLPNRG